MEYVLQGGDPSVSTTGTLPTLNATGANFVFTYYRRAAATGTTQTFEYSTNLGAGSWTPVSIPGGAVSPSPTWSAASTRWKSSSPKGPTPNSSAASTS